MSAKIMLLPMVIAAVLTFTGAEAIAQQRGAVNKISLGPSIAFPTGNAAKTYRRSFAASIAAEYNVAKNINLTGSAGYMGFTYRKDVKTRLENYGEESSVSGVVPLKAGARYYFGGIYYVDAMAGLVLSTGENNYNSFSYAPGAGANIPLTGKYSMEFGLRYESWVRDSRQIAFIGARLALAYSL